MASKYLQKYPVPSKFEQILHDFAREVLRDQPDNIIEYAASYFEMMEQGKKFQYESKFNVKKADKKTNLEYNSKASQGLSKRAINAVNKINENPQLEQTSKDSKGVIESKKISTVNIQSQNNKDVKNDEKQSVGQQPSINNFSLDPQGRPISGASRKSGVGYQPSSNTLMRDEGHKYVNQVNNEVTRSVVKQAEKEQETSQIIQTGMKSENPFEKKDNDNENNFDMKQESVRSKNSRAGDQERVQSSKQSNQGSIPDLNQRSVQQNEETKPGSAGDSEKRSAVVSAHGSIKQRLDSENSLHHEPADPTPEGNLHQKIEPIGHNDQIEQDQTEKNLEIPQENNGE